MSTKAEAKRPSQVFASRMREARERKRWSQQDMADRLSEMGEPTDRATLARTETLNRGLSLDDAIAYSAALGASFVHMVCPLEAAEPVALAPGLVLSARHVRDWMRGQREIRPEDQRTFITEAPQEELVARQQVLINVASERLQDVVDAIVADDRERAADLIDELNPLLAQIRREITDGPRS